MKFCLWKRNRSLQQQGCPFSWKIIVNFDFFIWVWSWGNPLCIPLNVFALKLFMNNWKTDKLQTLKLQATNLPFLFEKYINCILLVLFIQISIVKMILFDIFKRNYLGRIKRSIINRRFSIRSSFSLRLNSHVTSDVWYVEKFESWYTSFIFYVD